MRNKPSIKKPQLDLEAEALKFAAGEAQQEQPGTGITGPAEQHGRRTPSGKEAKHKEAGHHKDAGRRKKAVQSELPNCGIRIREGGNDHCTIQAEGSMTIYEAAQLKPLLLEALQKHQHIEVDLSEVNEMDTAGMQLLLLLKRTAGRTRKSVSLVAHSPATLDVIDRYNLGGYFGDPVVIPSTAS